ncbi:MAG: BlaI/MecI/CopY family transcriptional regulator [Saprospiraceae bacterium]|nr:BlaI/MecI/CopY family transcriptional regulator [Candidatus Defluviibacterium haderslevense]
MKSINMLTPGEENIIQIIWKIGPCTMSQIMEYFRNHQLDDNMPAPTTVSTFLRILVDKKYLNFKAYGKTYEYFAIVSKNQYAAMKIKSMIRHYFSNKPEELVSFLVTEEKLTEVEINKLLSQLKDKSKKK